MLSSREPQISAHRFADSFSAIMDDLIEGCQIVDHSWRYLYVNNTVVHQGRRSREELLGRTMMEMYPGIERTPMFALLRECMETRAARRMDNEFLYPDGSRGWFELRFNPVPEGVFIFSLDITDRKFAEVMNEHLNSVLLGVRNVNQLITREKNRDALIRSACDLLVEARGFRAVLIGLTGPAGNVIADASAGESLAEMCQRLELGEVPACAREAIATGEIVRRRPGDACEPGCICSVGFTHGDDALAISLDHEGRSYGFMILFVPSGLGGDPDEHSLLREAAGDIAFALHAMRVGDEGEEIRHNLIQTEEQLRQAQKLEAIGRLASGVAHDFNNILMVQMGYCDLMLEDIRPGEPLHEEITEIAKCAERAAGLSRQLLAFSRKQTLQPRILDLNDVVVATERMLRRLIGEDIDFVTSLSPNLHAVRADPGQIEQVIMNLAVNARDAMPLGGRLTIETANVELGEDYAEGHVGAVPGPHVMLAVTDSGTGMEAATLQRLFEPFFTTKEKGKGTGLGLATVYGIVKQSGGDIWVYSEPGEGTTFKVYLPRVTERLETEARREGAAPAGNGESILVVEDDPALRGLFLKMIASLGFAVESAAGGEEALDLVRSRDLQPRLLITDVVMPGMTGRQLAERLAAIRPEMKVLYTSGYTDGSILHHGVLDGEVAFLQKPFTQRDLISKIRELMPAE
jgi:PAS domain S-box-containing protein